MSQLPKEMRDIYIERRYADLKSLKECLQKNSAQEFLRVGHQIRGNALNFGFSSLEPLAHKMETVNAENLHLLGPQLIQELADWLEAPVADPEE